MTIQVIGLRIAGTILNASSRRVGPHPWMAARFVSSMLIWRSLGARGSGSCSTERFTSCLNRGIGSCAASVAGRSGGLLQLSAVFGAEGGTESSVVDEVEAA